MVEVRRLVRRNFGINRRPAYRALAMLFSAAIWPLAALWVLFDTRRSLGSDVVSIHRLPGAYWTALRHNVLPSEYFVYGLWQPERKVNIDSYLYTHEAPRFFKLFNCAAQPNPIDDKLAFHKLCKQQELPSPDILAVFGPTGESRQFESGKPPKSDLFIKPRISSGTENECLRWQGAAFASTRNCLVGADELGRYLEGRAKFENQTLLVQPALQNHPQLNLDDNAELATVRLITGLSADGDVIPIFGYLIYFVPADPRARVAVVDVASGRLITPIPSRVPIKHQMDIGPEDCGRLPAWKAALRHVQVAHRACSSFTFVGWDIAFTDQGPMLLEGNAHWAASEYQRLRGEPLGHTIFSQLLESRLLEGA
jgi:hypothetical protein